MRKRYCRRRLVQGIFIGVFAFTRQQPKVLFGPKEKRPTTVAETRVGSVIDSGDVLALGPSQALFNLTREICFDGHIQAEKDNNGAKPAMSLGPAEAFRRRTTYVYDPGSWRDPSTVHAETSNNDAKAESSQRPADVLQRTTTYIYDSGILRDPLTGRSIEIGQARSITTYTFDANGSLLSIKEWPEGDRDQGIGEQSE